MERVHGEGKGTWGVVRLSGERGGGVEREEGIGKTGELRMESGEKRGE